MSKLKNVTVLTTCAMLVAIAIVLGFLKIPVNQFVEIRFGVLPVAVAGMLFGPAAGGIVGGLADIGGYLVKPTGPFFPGFTLSTILAGVIFGLILYRKEIRLSRILAANAVHAAVVSLVLNTIWLCILYHAPAAAMFAGRALKTLIMYPIECAMLMLVTKPVSVSGFTAKLRHTMEQR